MKLATLAGKVLHGYARLLRTLAEAVFVLAGMTGAALAISYPVWWLATNHRGLYTFLVLGAGAALILFLLFKRFVMERGRPRSKYRSPILRKLVTTCCSLMGAYAVAVLTARSIALGVALAVTLLAAIGVWAFSGGGPAERRR